MSSITGDRLSSLAELLQRSITEENDIGIFESSCVAAAWCRLGKLGPEPEDVGTEMIRRLWLLALADWADLDVEDLMALVHHQRVCHLEKLSSNCPLKNIFGLF